MADLHPFRAVRPHPPAVSDVCCAPYDVVSTAEARNIAAGHSRSFLRVIRPEIELPETENQYDDVVYERGAANMQAFLEASYTVREEAPSLYVYRVDTGERAQTGVFGCVSVADYDDGKILKHEATRPAKVRDRARHIDAQQAHAEPVMLTYRGSDSIDALVESITTRVPPLFDFEDQAARHMLWRIEEPARWQRAFERVARLYIADGHHRCKAASRVARRYRTENGQPPPEAQYFPAVLFPMHEMHIMAYNRVLTDLDRSPAAVLDAFEQDYMLVRSVDYAVPRQKGHVCVYANGAWHDLTLPPAQGPRTVDTLDAARLTDGILRPLFGITDPRHDTRIAYIGGIRGPEAVQQRVDTGAADVGFSMHPTSIEELVAVSDEGDLMPPKSTWFEPKLISGMLVHTF
ncbi:MAG: DUF1015 family protein [Longimonas sp.]|uniref:DUF1015 domain-containing protein n=1 Tax=Longimonas sp. TaxID=2039626 RepID=UPI003975D483